jgi:hypothetical protein
LSSLRKSGVSLANESWLSPESKLIVHKAARSVTELQPNLSNVTDVILFLEILGYDHAMLQKDGFKSVHDFANYVYQTTDFYDEEKQLETNRRNKQFETIVPSFSKRLVDGLSLMAPWIGVLALLYLTGFSLWMSRALPADITIAFVGGVFIGLIASEGQLIAFSRIFSFHYFQGNIVEARRVLKRHYLFTTLSISVLSFLVFVGGVILVIPPTLVLITILGFASIFVHRASYLLLFSTKKSKEILLGFLMAIVVFYIAINAFVPETLSENTNRYFMSLTVSLLALSVVPAYRHYRLFGGKIPHSQTKISVAELPKFYSATSGHKYTINSRFGIQVWENLSFLIYGVFYFILLFGDRIISWFYTPGVLIASNGVALPLIFNSAYHVGADLALFTIIPGAIYQFMVLSPFQTQINNMTLALKISNISLLNNFIRVTYKKMIFFSLLIGLIFAGLLFIFGPYIIHFLGGTDVTINILRVSSLGSVFLSVFAGNAAVLIFLNRGKYLVLITIISAIALLSLGMHFGSYGYGNIVYAYLIATVIAASSSSAYVLKIIGNASSILFAKYS